MSLAELVSILEASGPYGVVAILCWAFWKVLARKDKELVDQTQIIIDLARTQTEAMHRTEGALTALTAALRARPLK